MRGLEILLIVALLKVDLTAGCQVNKSFKKQLTQYWHSNKYTEKKGRVESFSEGPYQIIFVGTNHFARTGTDSYLKALDSVAVAFHPDMILVEGNNLIPSSKEVAVESFGDFSLGQFLAFSNNTNLLNWDCDWTRVYNEIINKFGAENGIFSLLTHLLSLPTPAKDLTFREFFSETVERSLSYGIPISDSDVLFKRYVRWYSEFFPGLVFNFNLETFHQQSYHRQHNALYKSIITLFMVERDLQLIDRIVSSLKDNHKILIQAGAAHLQSLKNILPQVLKQSSVKHNFSDNERISKVQINGDPLDLHKLEISNHLIFVKRVANGDDWGDSALFSLLQKAEHKSTIILNSNTTARDNKVYSFPNSLTPRHLDSARLFSKINVGTYDPEWQELYNSLKFKFSYHEIFLTALSRTISKNLLEFENYDLDTLIDQAITTLLSSGFPVRTELSTTDSIIAICQTHIADSKIFGRYKETSFRDTNGNELFAIHANGYFQHRQIIGKFSYAIPGTYFREGKSVADTVILNLKFNNENDSIYFNGKLFPPGYSNSGTYINRIFISVTNKEIIKMIDDFCRLRLRAQIQKFSKSYDTIIIIE